MGLQQQTGRQPLQPSGQPQPPAVPDAAARPSGHSQLLQEVMRAANNLQASVDANARAAAHAASAPQQPPSPSAHGSSLQQPAPAIGTSEPAGGLQAHSGARSARDPRLPSRPQPTGPSAGSYRPPRRPRHKPATMAQASIEMRNYQPDPQDVATKPAAGNAAHASQASTPVSAAELPLTQGTAHVRAAADQHTVQPQPASPHAAVSSPDGPPSAGASHAGPHAVLGSPRAPPSARAGDAGPLSVSARHRAPAPCHPALPADPKRVYGGTAQCSAAPDSAGTRHGQQAQAQPRPAARLAPAQLSSAGPPAATDMHVSPAGTDHRASLDVMARQAFAAARSPEPAAEQDSRSKAASAAAQQPLRGDGKPKAEHVTADQQHSRQPASQPAVGTSSQPPIPVRS